LGAGRRTHTRSSGLGFAFADSVDFVESGAWDRLTEGSSIFLSRAYLRTMGAPPRPAAR
jgi:hypothetical protein